MKKPKESQETKTIWTNPDKPETETRAPKSFRLPDSTVKAIDRLAGLKGESQADIIISAVRAYQMNYTSISEKAKDLREFIDNQVNDIDYNVGEDMGDNEYKYRQLIFQWSEQLEKFL